MFAYGSTEFTYFDLFQGAPSENSRRIRSAPSKIAAKHGSKINGYTNPVKAVSRVQQIAPLKPTTPSPEPSKFRLNTIVLSHE